jgi:hypothetical protein
MGRKSGGVARTGPGIAPFDAEFAFLESHFAMVAAPIRKQSMNKD